MSASGEPNLGGLTEPLKNNCAERDLVVSSPTTCKPPFVDKLYRPGYGYALWEVVPGEVIHTYVYVQNGNAVDSGHVYEDVIERMITECFIIDAVRGINSLIRIPGTDVETVPKGPRTSSGASGFSDVATYS